MTNLIEQLQSTLGPAYAIEGELSGGGMSRVFVVADAALGRQVVVKILPPDLAGSVSLERFRREIQIAAQLQHPCIVPVLSAGVMDGLPYYTMPFVAGESLRSRLAKVGTIPAFDAMKILRDVASALVCAHERGVAHRDLKPENVLLSSGYALVTDFGVAKALTAAGSRGSERAGSTSDHHTHALTLVGTTLGTPAYMAPEQVLGDAGANERVDIYAFGVMAYEMLAGAHPYAHRQTQAMFVAHVVDTPAPLAGRQAQVPTELAAIVTRCMAKSPNERPTAKQLVEALDEISSPYTTSLSTRLRTPPASIVQEPSATPTLPSIAVLPFSNLSADPDNDYLSDGITEEILNALAQLRTIHVAARTSSFAFKGKQVDLREIGERLRVGTVLEGSVRRSGDRLRITAQLIDVATGYHLWSKRYDRRLADVFEIQDEIAGAIVETLEVTLLRTPSAPLTRRPTTSLEAWECYLRGRYFLNQAGSGIDKALDLFEQALGHDPEFAQAHAAIADLFISAGIFDMIPPTEAFPMARVAAQRALALDAALPEVHTALGMISLFHDWDASAAQSSFEQAVSLSPSSVHANTWLSMYHVLCGDSDAAIAWAHRSIEIDPLHAPAYYTEIYALYSARRWKETIECAARVLDLNPSYAEGVRCLGMAQLALGQVDEGIATLRHAVAIDGRFAWGIASLITALARHGEEAEARRLLAELEGRREREWVASMSIAGGHLGLGQIDEAFANLERALAARECWLVSMRVEPLWDPLTSDPRFEPFVARIGLG